MYFSLHLLFEILALVHLILWMNDCADYFLTAIEVIDLLLQKMTDMLLLKMFYLLFLLTGSRYFKKH